MGGGGGGGQSSVKKQTVNKDNFLFFIVDDHSTDIVITYNSFDFLCYKQQIFIFTCSTYLIF